MSISTAICKQAIVNIIKMNPGCVAKEFVDIDTSADGIKDFERLALRETSWKRTEKRTLTQSDVEFANVPAGTVLRSFECSATEQAREYYEDQLRAYVYADKNKILRIDIRGE